MPVQIGDELDPLVPPVSEQLGIERRHDDRFARGTGSHRVAPKHPVHVAGMAPRPRSRDVGLVRLLEPEIRLRMRDAPELESAGEPDLVKLEVAPVPREPTVTTPDLPGRERVAHERDDSFPSRPGDTS